jgi:hypothetical protein
VLGEQRQYVVGITGPGVGRIEDGCLYQLEQG